MEKSFDSEWEEIHSTKEWGAYPSEHIIRFIARNYYKRERKFVKILDFGCGAGAHTWYLAREGFDTYAFDGSKSAIARLEERLRRESLKASVKCCDALNLEYQDCYFDAVIDNVCIYSNYLRHIREMYKKVYDMLKNGGKLCTVCFGKQTDGYGSGDLIETDTYKNVTEGALVHRGLTHFFSRSELYNILQETGFSNIQIDSILYTDGGFKVEQYVAIAEK